MISKKFNLLVISDRYPHDKDTISSSFVKSQVDCMAKYFDKIYVISLTPNVPKCLSAFSFMNPRWQRDAFACNYRHNNINVYFAKHFTLPFDFSRKRRGDTAFAMVDKIIKNEQIEFSFIHAHFIYPSGYVGAKLKEKYSRPLIITGHGHDIYDMPFKSPEWMARIKKILDFSDHIITPSKSNYDKLMQIGIPSEKVSVIPNGYDSTIFKRPSVNDARRKLNIPADKRVILSVGNLEIEKGHMYLVEAMEIVSKRRTDIVCFIVGSGGKKKELIRLINRLEVNNFLKLVGSKPHDEIPMWMNACDVFVLPSLSESFGIVQIEAMACGKPVVATKNGGSEEIVIEDKLGILVEPKDPEGLLQAILVALEVEWDAEYIREYSKQFAWERIAEKIVKVYEEVLSE
jgi:teichuronic acid biosynthesis glycosyltransferase TuaC